jgi:hypothetical protein
MATLATDRTTWIDYAQRLAKPVLSAMAAGRLREAMPVESRPGAEAGRRKVTHLEAVGRLLAGVAPWLATGEDRELASLAQRAIAVGVDPGSPAMLNFSQPGQPVVDAAFLAHAVLRAPDLLWHSLDAQTQTHFVAAMKSTRVTRPPFNNWLLFSAMVEAFLALAGQEWDAMRVDYAVRQHLEWYKGDGAYGDGPNFHFDYYNSYVIQPMLLDVIAEASRHLKDWAELQPIVLKRAQRYAAVQERLIAPDGSFPVIGRSMAYRCGAFQALAQLSLQQSLPEELPPAQARSALSAVIARTLGAPGTFDDAGWLRIGLAGHQPDLAESYISTGSLYLCSTALLPLGLPASGAFWSASPLPFTGQKAWGGHDLPADHAMHDG